MRVMLHINNQTVALRGFGRGHLTWMDLIRRMKILHSIRGTQSDMDNVVLGPLSAVCSNNEVRQAFRTMPPRSVRGLVDTL